MKTDERQRKDQHYLRAAAKMRWIAAGLIVLFSLATGLLVNFFNNLHYNNLLLQANSKAGAAQTELNAEQYDVKLLIDNNKGQLNCYVLHSEYVRSICRNHNNTVN